MIQIKKTILTLVALLAVTTGAWAQTETLLTTITPTGTGTYSETTPGVVTVTHDNIDFDGDFGWLWHNEGAITVEAKEGYTITKCVFSQPYDKTVTVSTAPFKVNFIYNEEYLNYNCEGFNPDFGIMDGVFSIEVYGGVASSASAVTVDWNKTSKTGTFKMPGGNVELEPEYYPQAALTAQPTAINDVPATTDGAIVKAGTVKNIGETTTAQGTVMYYVSTTALDDAALLALAADDWTADVPTAQSLAQGQAYVYYYVRGNDGDTDETTFSDGDIKAANALTVTIAAAPTYAVTFADDLAEPTEWTAEPNTGVTKGETVTVTYSGTKKVLGVKAEKKSSTPSLSLTSPEVGQIIGSDGKNYAAANVPSGVDKVAMIAYVSGSNGLAIALADEGQMNWATAKSTCEAKTPAFTGGTWKLPTKDEWNQMFIANGGSEESYDGLNTAITTAGGTAFQDGTVNYWSSSEYNSDQAYYAQFYYGYPQWLNDWRVNDKWVRACLAF